MHLTDQEVAGVRRLLRGGSAGGAGQTPDGWQLDSRIERLAKGMKAVDGLGTRLVVLENDVRRLDATRPHYMMMILLAALLGGLLLALAIKVKDAHPEVETPVAATP